MFCKECGNQCEDTAKFCVKCGAKLAEIQTESQEQNTDVKVHITNGDEYRKKDEIINGVSNGKVKITLPSGAVYEGDFIKGKRHGKGKTTGYNNGDVYEGDYIEDKMHGKGKYTFSSGDVYEGDFIEGKMHGKGKFTYSDGRVQEGEWKDGEFVEQKPKRKRM